MPRLATSRRRNRVGHDGLDAARRNDSEKNRADASLIYQMLARISLSWGGHP